MPDPDPADVTDALPEIYEDEDGTCYYASPRDRWTAHPVRHRSEPGGEAVTTTYPIVPTWPQPVAPAPQQGWQCPVCGSVYAPWVAKCNGTHGPTTITTNVTFDAAEVS